MTKLALHGGVPAINGFLPPYCSIGEEEFEAVAAVMRSGCLSDYYGSLGDHFLGGPKVRELEEAWSDRFRCSHAIAVNSAASGIVAAMGAIGLQPGDEVILPPYTMSATAMAPLVYGGIPVFADVETETFCLDPDEVRRLLTGRTKAIIAVNLMGHPARLKELRSLADEHGIFLIEDNAQSPLASEEGLFAGTVGHIGVFSLNYHKHIHAGEGGICVTDDPNLAFRLQLIRNHGENCVGGMEGRDLTNLVGFNFRMTELTAAVALVQLRNIEVHVDRRRQIAEALSSGLGDLAGLRVPVVRSGCTHVYYCWSVVIDEEELGVSRGAFCDALTAEGFPNSQGYVRPLYLLPVFQQKIAIGSGGWPFSLSSVRYEKGICPRAERLHERDLFLFEPCAYALTSELTGRLTEAFRKVHDHRDSLCELS